jgi:hypothetical protein
VVTYQLPSKGKYIIGGIEVVPCLDRGVGSVRVLLASVAEPLISVVPETLIHKRRRQPDF